MMYDFKKQLGQKPSMDRVTDPVALYGNLDRESDKGPLRDPQRDVLSMWHEERRNDRDLILKLHTGQGKTLIGLLMLQSQLNAGKGPALYLCPSHFLVQQTCRQAREFGFRVVEFDKELPDDFTDAKSILVTIPQKLFHGYTKFGLNEKSQPIGTLLLDDAHACVDIIREQFTIRLGHDQDAYRALRDLFTVDLEAQGAGTCSDLLNGDYDAILQVPYWAWLEKEREVTKILASHRKTDEINYVWPLLKDMLAHCTCFMSGKSLEIAPTLPPLDMFGSYAKAKHRVFMSATVANDAFLVKGLGMDVATVKRPLVYEQETWFGEKMILIPSLIDDSLDRSTIVNWIGKPKKDRNYGVVALTSSFGRSKDWEQLGAVVPKTTQIDEVVERLRAGKRDDVAVFANRYDGIDLPDAACRVLIVDSKPFAESVQERYMERCLGDTDAITTAIARKIEQGIGRSVRGEKDYCAFLLLGPDLVKHVRTKDARRYLSEQTQQQIEIGLEIVEMGKEGLTDQVVPLTALVNAMNLCLGRDAGWKEFYVKRMNEMVRPSRDFRILDQFVRERDAELKFHRGDIDGAKAILQGLADQSGITESQRGWYLQESARYEYSRSKSEANTLQIAAHKLNRALLRPQTGMQVKKITLLSQKRVENCRKWIANHSNSQELLVAVEALLGDLRFGVGAERFESALDQLGRALGFVCERPDREWKEGPDNLWAVRDKQYVLMECKSEVELTRAEIHKSETDQMNRSSDWFRKNYGEDEVTRIMIIPTKAVGRASAFRDATVIMRDAKLEALRRNVRAFFREFTNVDLGDLASSRIQELIAIHKLSVDDIVATYTERPRNVHRPEQ
jgi:replicative superfamily II helicase